MANTEQNSNTTTVQKLMQAGAHFGHIKSKWNPKMSPYIFTIRDGFHIIDLTKTDQFLNAALEFLDKSVSEEKNILFVGTKISSKNLIKEIIAPTGFPYILERWVGGTLTNFDFVVKRLEYFKSLKAKKESGELEKYTKYERQMFEKELNSLDRMWGGIKNLTKKPDIVFIIDPSYDKVALKETLISKIPIVAMVNTDADPTNIEYIIPINNDSITTQRYVLEEVAKILKKSKVKN